MDKVKPKGKPGLLLAIGFVLLGVGLVSATSVSLLEKNAADWVQHTLEVENSLNRLDLMASRAVARQRGYLLTDRQDYLQGYRQALAELPRNLADLERQTDDNPEQQQSVMQLRRALGERAAELDEAVMLHQSGRNDQIKALLATGRGQAAMTRAEQLLDQMRREEERLLAVRRQTADDRARLGLAVLGVSTLLVILLGLLARSIVRQYLRDLKERYRELAEEMRARTHAQHQVRQLQKMEAVGQLTGGIAHDFNNMLAIIVGSLDIARRRLSREDLTGVSESLDQAQIGAQRAVSLTSQLLAFSRSQALAPRVLEPNRLVSAMSEMLRRTLGERVQIETVLGGGLWRVCADASQIENMLVNLALNARDAMPEGGKLTIETANTELDDRYARAHEEVKAGQYVMISVTDTGAGMPPEVIERAFEPFFTTKGVGRGTGLGLSQVFGFVKQSDGHIKIYSEIGKGTTIKVYLPRYVGTDKPVEPTHPNDEVPHARDGERILVVEDEAQVRAMTVGMLRDLGYAVIEAADGEEALALLDGQGPFSLMFTDVVMPGLTGRALADQARIRHPELNVLYTTGYTRNSIVHNGIVDHDVALIQKPFTMDDLARKIRQMLDRN